MMERPMESAPGIQTTIQGVVNATGVTEETKEMKEEVTESPAAQNTPFDSVHSMDSANLNDKTCPPACENHMTNASGLDPGLSAMPEVQHDHQASVEDDFEGADDDENFDQYIRDTQVDFLQSLRDVASNHNNTDDTADPTTFRPDATSSSEGSESDTPPPTKRCKTKKTKATPKPKKKSSAKGRGQRKKGDQKVTLADIQDNDFMAHAKVVEESIDMPGFASNHSRAEAFKEMAGNITKDQTKDQKKQFSADKRALNFACTKFGRLQIKPADDGLWAAAGMRTTLRPHQVLGTAFMLRRELDPDAVSKGGILADEMGLGKTITTLALITNQQKDKPQELKPTLIIAPKSLLEQWKREITQHCESRNDRGRGVGQFLIYKQRHFRNHSEPLKALQANHILLTTYHEIVNSFPYADPPPNMIDEVDIDTWRETHFHQNKGLLHQIDFHRIILDEAHIIRNPLTKCFQAVHALKAKHHWCLTGTVAVNGPYDIWSLLKFIRSDADLPYERFKSTYSGKASAKDTEKYEDLIQGCLLRRTHANKMFSARIVKLPATYMHTVKVNFSPVERAIYDVFRRRFLEKVAAMSSEIGEDGELTKKQRVYAISLMLRLRQLTAHPVILQHTYLDILEVEDLEELAEIMEDNTLTMNDHSRNTMRLLRQRLSEELTKRREGIARLIRLPDADQLPAASQSASVRKQTLGRKYGEHQRYPELLKGLLAAKTTSPLAAMRSCAVCGSTPRNPEVLSCLHVCCSRCLHQLLMDTANSGLPKCPTCDIRFEWHEPLNPDIYKEEVMKKRKYKEKNPFKVDMNEVYGTQTAFLPSAKTLIVKCHILEFMKKRPGCKIVIFSQWMLMLRILEGMCKFEGWQSRFYHGGMDGQARQDVLDDFQFDDEVHILLCSLKSGGVGLNLTMAQCAINIDHWFNTALEKQAFARVYRIGQEHETEMVSLTVAGSVDEEMEAIKARKQMAIDNIDGKANLAGNMTKQDIMRILGTELPAGPDQDEGTSEGATEGAHEGAAEDAV